MTAIVMHRELHKEIIRLHDIPGVTSDSELTEVLRELAEIMVHGESRVTSILGRRLDVNDSFSSLCSLFWKRTCCRTLLVLSNRTAATRSRFRSSRPFPS